MGEKEINFSLMIKTVDKIKAELLSNKWPARHRPIELQTENGFSIIRRCDIDKSISASGTEHRFIVRDPDGYELEIAVDIADEAVAEIVRRSRGRLSFENSYWINCAERHLATYLWKHGDYPQNAKLTVDYLTPDDLDLARRREGQVAEDPSKSTQSLLRFESGSHLGVS